MLDNKNSKLAMLTLIALMLVIVSTTPMSVFSTTYLTEVVSTESTAHSFHPSLDVDTNGNIHVAWEDYTDYGGSGGDWDIFYKAKIDGSWTTTEVVSTESTRYSEYLSLAVDPDGNIHVAWHDNIDPEFGGDIDVFYKAKIGGSWTATELVSFGGTEESLSPSLAVDPDGNIHIVWKSDLDYGGAGPHFDVFFIRQR